MIARAVAAARLFVISARQLAEARQHILPNLFGIVLDPTGLRIDLPVVAHGAIDHLAGASNSTALVADVL